jgi:hypothetical protein
VNARNVQEITLRGEVREIVDFLRDPGRIVGWGVESNSR